MSVDGGVAVEQLVQLGPLGLLQADLWGKGEREKEEGILGYHTLQGRSPVFRIKIRCSGHDISPSVHMGCSRTYARNKADS